MLWSPFGILAASIAMAVQLCQTGEATGPTGPAGVGGLTAWYQADAIPDARDGGLVKRWSDSGPREIPLEISGGAPAFVRRAIGGLPAVRFREQQPDSLQTPVPLSGLAGNPGFTVFMVAKVARPKTQWAHPLGWGDPSRRGGGLFLEFEAGHVDLGTGCNADATTADQSYASYFEKPAIVTCVKSPGPMNRSTRTAYNGVWQAVSGSNIVPRVKETPFHVGGGTPVGYISPAMDLAEIVLFSRPLMLDEENRVGYYLQQKYAIAGRFVRPDKFFVQDLEIHVLPPEIADAAGFAERTQHERGSTCDAAAESRIVLRSAAGTRGFVFDHWEGDVLDRKSATATVRLDQSKAITAVYREQKREFFIAAGGRDTWSGTLPQAERRRHGRTAGQPGGGPKRHPPTQTGVRRPAALFRAGLSARREVSARRAVCLDCRGQRGCGFPSHYTAYAGETPVLTAAGSCRAGSPTRTRSSNARSPGKRAARGNSGSSSITERTRFAHGRRTSIRRTRSRVAGRPWRARLNPAARRPSATSRAHWAAAGPKPRNSTGRTSMRKNCFRTPWRHLPPENWGAVLGQRLSIPTAKGPHGDDPYGK